MMKSLWIWLVVANDEITCSFALYSISFTLNILLSAIPTARKYLFHVARNRVQELVDRTVNAGTLANIDDNSKILVVVGKLFKWLVTPCYREKENAIKWLEFFVLFVMVCFASASVLLLAFEHKSRLGLLFCLPFPLYFLIYTILVLLWFVLVKLLSFVIRKRCAPREEPKKKKPSDVFSEIASMTGSANSISNNA